MMNIHNTSFQSSSWVSRKTIGYAAAGGAILGISLLAYFANRKTESQEPSNRKFIILTNLENTDLLNSLAASGGQDLLLVGLSLESRKSKLLARKILNQNGVNGVPVVQGKNSRGKRLNKLQIALKQALEAVDFNSIRIALSSSGADLAKILYEFPYLQDKIQHIYVLEEYLKNENSRDHAASSILMRMTNIPMTIYFKTPKNFNPNEAEIILRKKGVRIDIDWKNSKQENYAVSIYEDPYSNISIAEETRVSISFQMV